jgi:hypothetical protein
MRRLLTVVAALFLIAACGGNAPTGSPSESLPATCGRDTCQFEDEILAFDYPASWHAATYNVVSSFSNDLVYISTAPLSDPCDRTASSVACVRLAATSLGTNGARVNLRGNPSDA